MAHSEIVNLVNSYHYLFDEKENVVENLSALFAEDCEIQTENFGSANGLEEVKELLQAKSDLIFLQEVRHVVQSHVVVMTNETTATVTSYVTAYWKCNPVTLSKWEDQVILVNGTNWCFQSRKCVDLQKNFELIADMQLRGKKSYSEPSE